MTETEKAEQSKLILVVALTAGQVLHETLDELEYSSFYKHSLKQATKRMQKELTSTCDQYIDLLWKGDEDMARQIQEGVENIAKTIATMDPSKIVLLGELLEKGTIKYVENGEITRIELKDNSEAEAVVE